MHYEFYNLLNIGMALYNINRGILFLLFMGNLIALSQGQDTRVGFYSTSCPSVESIVQSTVSSHFKSDPTIAPALLRMHFHDCFVEGCDASILIDGANTEKTSQFNVLLRGYEVIDDAKQQLETACPRVVSCADIIALAARDSVVLTGGPSWDVPTGRFDGRVSQASAAAKLPGLRDSMDVQKQKFLDKNLNTQDLVALSGGHTIGTSACKNFQFRLYNFTAEGGPDPTIDAVFLPILQNLCPADGDETRRVGMDNGSDNRFDNSYFNNLRDGRGVLESDQMLWEDTSTQNVVQSFLGVSGQPGLNFSEEFGRSMVKMGNVEVKTSSNGEIRKVCSAIN